MSKIIQLDPILANQIAAGEVVERPVSVIKELVENAIDSGATNIGVEIKEGGKSFMSVSDNGSGIEKEDLSICIDKHTTSKISSIQDLYSVMTFGFRGEALSSISSVSKFTLISKTKDSQVAYKLSYSSLSGKTIEETSSNDGTQVIVEDLFFNTPARLNYIKTEKTEYGKILEYLQKVSLSYPEIGFEFWNDDKKILKVLANETVLLRIYGIYGDDFSSHLREIGGSSVGIEISGYISDPKISFANKTKQQIFVNHRPIFSSFISKAISDAYNRFIPHGQHPGYIIFIQVDPTLVDVNVHPRKQEVRFANEGVIFRCIYDTILGTLNKISLINTPDESIDENEIFSQEISDKGGNENEPEIHQFFSVGNNTSYSPTTSTNASTHFNEYYTGSGTKFKSYSPYKNISPNPDQSRIIESIEYTKAILGNKAPSSLSHSSDIHETKLGKIIGQAYNSYILVEQGEKIVLFDQHALAERILYEKLLSNTSKNVSQSLLIPINITVSPEEISLLSEYNEIFQTMGFELEILSHNIISLIALPNFIQKENIQEIFLGVLQDMQQGNTFHSITLQEVKNKIFAYTACRSAIKFGNKLNVFEMQHLLNEATMNYSSTCPHGRPVIFEISLQELKGKYER